MYIDDEYDDKTSSRMYGHPEFEICRLTPIYPFNSL